ncbi:MAG: nucleotidyltransferase domain-containing protein [Bacteroidales bacterium]|nr:nucleotidyltransferase domain-containing protein [Bacteroidales bacterium]
MIPQLYLIDKVKQASLNDDNVSAVLMYGSFIKGEGDRFSDVEFYVFTKDKIDKWEWINQVEKIDLLFVNEHGTDVAIFHNLIRGEFHFHSLSEIGMIHSWQGYMSFRYKDKMIISDKEGELKKILDSIELVEPDYHQPEYAETAVQMLINYLIFSKNVLLRGELAHAHQLFFFIQRALLWLIRLHTGCTQHYESPTKKLEEDIPEQWYNKFKTCIPGISRDELVRCHTNSVLLARELCSAMHTEEKYQRILERIDEII